MHFNFGFTAVQILWTLTFAAQLVLLVVLLGRERMRRFPWFAASIVLVTLRLLASRLLFGRLPQITSATIFIAMADLVAILGLLVMVELARRAFATARPRTWIVGTLATAAVGIAVLALWGAWPAWKTLIADSSYLGVLRLMQLVAQKGELLVNVLTVELSLLIVLFGRRFKAGWRSHTQQIAIGLSTMAIAQLAVQAIWQIIATTAAPHSRDEYMRILGLRDKLLSANNVVYLAVLVWWVAWLWFDEPGTPRADEASAEGITPAKTYLEFGGTVAAPAELPAQIVDVPVERQEDNIQ
ncbi:MAG: hypothetical protein ABSE99_12725 [Terracidiphilus sp.]|jgi:hypothetical protein